MRKSNKRATLVCTRCHEKKIKCDLQTLTGQTSQRCTGCAEAFAECRYRPSQRGAARRRDLKAIQSLSTGRAEPASGLGEPSQVRLQSNPAHRAALDGDYDSSNNPWPSPLHDQPTRADQPLSLPRCHGPVIEQVVDVQNPCPPTMTPGQKSQSSQGNSHRAAYLGDSGFMSIFSHDLAEDDSTNPEVQRADLQPLQLLPVLRESYLDTYFEYCYTWCPVLDRSNMQSCPEFFSSQLLREALALLGSQLAPPLIRHLKPSEHFQRFRQLFYDNYESQPLVRIISIMLLYWWSSGPPNVASIDTNWWWTGASIRLAQEIGLHRERNAECPLRPGETDGLRRRIWWTLFARERLTALMQGRPCAIDPDYCNLRMASVDDFPDPRDPKAEIFVQWVRLCEIIGRVGKAIAQGTICDIDSKPAKDLLNWPQALPNHLQLPISNYGTTDFNRDIHMLHLPYLATTILLHLQKTSEKLPRASMTAIIAASCVSRILQDVLGRGSLRYLPGQSGWYISISIIALLHARRVGALATHANADIAILLEGLKQMAVLWHSSQMFYAGFERILSTEKVPVLPSGFNTSAENQQINEPSHTPYTLSEITVTDDGSWRERFPYVTTKTSPLIDALWENTTIHSFTGFESSQVNFLFDFLDDLNPEILQVDLNI